MRPVLGHSAVRVDDAFFALQCLRFVNMVAGGDVARAVAFAAANLRLFEGESAVHSERVNALMAVLLPGALSAERLETEGFFCWRAVNVAVRSAEGLSVQVPDLRLAMQQLVHVRLELLAANGGMGSFA